LYHVYDYTQQFLKKQISRKGWKDSDRGTGFLFGSDTAEKFLKHHDFDMICRAHQVIDKGYEFPFYPTSQLVTIFSAPNYENCHNNGAILMVDQELKCSFTIFEPEN